MAKAEVIQGTVTFIQHNLPGLEAGEYMLKVAQAVSQEATPYENTYYFAVQGERFTLNPADIYAVFPPDQTQGEYTATLPHIVLTKQTLPWIRFPTVAMPPNDFPDQQHDRDVPTWLAILIFDEDDVRAFPNFQVTATSGKVRDLFFKRPMSGSQYYSYFYAVANLDHTSDAAAFQAHLDYGESPEDQCTYLDIPIGLLWQIAPSVDDLKMMAHVRNVEIIRKATENGTPASRNDLSAIPGTSNFAMVTGNRLPQTSKRTFAHLVSLEGLAPFLPIDPATSDNATDISHPTTVHIDSDNSFTIDPNGWIRLVSLASWSFTSTGDGKRFEELLLQLQPKNPVASGESPATTPYDFSFGLPVPPADPADSNELKLAKNALEMGYTAMYHHTRDAGTTVSWYRGPFLPYPVPMNTIPATFTSADAATIYNPDTGMFDVSYAAAWQLGRLLALQNKHYSVELYKWRHGNLRNCVAQMETIILQQTLDDIQQQFQNDELIYPLLASFAQQPDATASVGRFRDRSTLRATHQRNVLTNPADLGALLASSLTVPLEIYSWLANLKLLTGLPFNYLVPDERMLPAESIRFFYVDMNWTHALIDGALSVGRSVQQTMSPQVAHDLAVQSPVIHQVDQHARTVRTTTFGLAAPHNPDSLEVIPGFLLRSEVVKGWPGLEVNGYASDGTLMDIVRFERLGPTVLLCLFEKDNKLLGQVDIHEPAEGLHFGVVNTTPKSINVRYNFSDATHGAGQQTQDVMQPVPFRDTNARVLRVFRLAKDLLDPQYKPYIQHIYDQFDHLPSSEFAMQMLKGVGLVSFKLKTGGAS